AYFVKGLHIGDQDTLADLAAPVLSESRERILEFLAGDSGVGEVNEELAMAASHGITGVPTYVIEGQWAIPGAQDSDTFERVLRRAASRGDE
ncbi:MAG: DsbA family protein, partial [Actinobacteria bacterium]|nr:DsbA family protein [Actinomycetota bacterium]